MGRSFGECPHQVVELAKVTLTTVVAQLSGHDGCVCESLFTNAEHTDLLKLHPPTKTSRLHMNGTVGKTG